MPISIIGIKKLKIFVGCFHKSNLLFSKIRAIACPAMVWNLIILALFIEREKSFLDIRLCAQEDLWKTRPSFHSRRSQERHLSFESAFGMTSFSCYPGISRISPKTRHGMIWLALT